MLLKSSLSRNALVDAKACALELSTMLFQYLSKNPALDVALWCFIGASGYFLMPSFALFICLAFICLLAFDSSLSIKHLIVIKISLLALFGYCYAHFRAPPSIPNGHILKGSCLFHVTEKKETSLFGKKSLLYKGVAKTFQDAQGNTFNNIPCTLMRPLHLPLPASHQVDISFCELHSKDRSLCCIKVSRASTLQSPKGTFSWANWRYDVKQSILAHIKARYSDKKVLAFISAMAVGYLDNKTLMYEFSKTGIQHLLTISGFHFALLASFLAFFLKPLFPKKVFIALLMTLLTCYIIYLGPSPSVSRSWIAIMMLLIAYYYEIPSTAINYLGVASLCAFLEQPACLTQLGFQLSYLATFGILSYYRLCDRLMHHLLPARKLSTLCSFSLPKQLLCVLLTLMRRSLALDHAVNLITLPVILFHFESFPLFSFYFNLVIPVLLIPSLYLLLLGLLCTPIPYLEASIHAVNNMYTRCIIDCIAACPKTLEISFTYKNMKATTAVVALLLIFACMIVLEKRYHERTSCLKT